MGENKLLKMRRKKYEKNVTEKKNNGSKYLQKLTVRKFSPYPGCTRVYQGVPALYFLDNKYFSF